MDELKRTIKAALKSGDSIGREDVREWIKRAQDVETEALLYKFTRDAWYRIEPRLEIEETCILIRNYLFRCILKDPQNDVAMTRYEAAGDLEGWFDHLASKNDSQKILHELATAVTELFLRSDGEVQLAIETGFLEHILEQAAFRSLFSHWAQDERLRDAWERALAWGEAHPDMMKSMRERIRKIQSETEY